MAITTSLFMLTVSIMRLAAFVSPTLFMLAVRTLPQHHRLTLLSPLKTSPHQTTWRQQRHAMICGLKFNKRYEPGKLTFSLFYTFFFVFLSLMYGLKKRMLKQPGYLVLNGSAYFPLYPKICFSLCFEHFR